jgi:hypothetical protein
MFANLTTEVLKARVQYYRTIGQDKKAAKCQAEIDRRESERSHHDLPARGWR